MLAGKFQDAEDLEQAYIESQTEIREEKWRRQDKLKAKTKKLPKNGKKKKLSKKT